MSFQTGGNNSPQELADLVQQAYRPECRRRVRRSAFLAEQDHPRRPSRPSRPWVDSLTQAFRVEAPKSGSHDPHCFSPDPARDHVAGGHSSGCLQQLLLGDFPPSVPFRPVGGSCCCSSAVSSYGVKSVPITWVSSIGSISVVISGPFARSFRVTLQPEIRLNASGEAHVMSTTELPLHTTQVLPEPLFTNRSPSPAAQSDSARPLLLAVVDPQAGPTILCTDSAPSASQSRHFGLAAAHALTWCPELLHL